jgi:hypothetical protein
MPMTPSAIDSATFQFVAQYLKHCATMVPTTILSTYYTVQSLICEEKEKCTHTHTHMHKPANKNFYLLVSVDQPLFSKEGNGDIKNHNTEENV